MRRDIGVLGENEQNDSRLGASMISRAYDLPPATFLGAIQQTRSSDSSISQISEATAASLLELGYENVEFDSNKD